MFHGMVALQEWYETTIDNIQIIDWYEGSIYEKLQHYIWIYYLCGKMGLLAKIPKALDKDTQMQVYEVGHTPRFWVPKDIGLVLSLGFSPKTHEVGLTFRY